MLKTFIKGARGWSSTPSFWHLVNNKLSVANRKLANPEDLKKNVSSYAKKNDFYDFFPPGSPFLQKLAGKFNRTKKMFQPILKRSKILLHTSALYQPGLYSTCPE